MLIRLFRQFIDRVAPPGLYRVYLKNVEDGSAFDLGYYRSRTRYGAIRKAKERHEIMLSQFSPPWEYRTLDPL